MKKAKQRGGKRKGAGRHKVADPKLAIQFRVHKSKIDLIGGAKQVESICLDAIEEATKS